MHSKFSYPLKKGLFFIIPLLLWGCACRNSQSASEPVSNPRSPDVTRYVRFITNSDGVEFAKRLVPQGSKVAAPAPAPTRTGYAFLGWYPTTGALTAASPTFNFNTAITSNTTLYARWIRTYPVRFITNSGAPNFATQTIRQGSNAVNPSPAPERVGSTLAGWFWESSHLTPFNFDRNVITNATTLYAKWSTSTYSVRFITGGSSGIAAQTIAHGEKGLRPDDPTSNEYAFLGWYLTTGALTAASPTFNFNTAITSNTTLYARWIRTYPVRFITNSGAPNFATQTIRQGSNAVNPSPAPERVGSTFAGWFASSDFSGSAFNFATDTITAATKLYAGWRVPYTVSAVGARYQTNFYGDRTQPTLTWTVAAGSLATGQELWWGETAEAMTKLTDLGANSRSYTVPSGSVAAINGQKTYYWRLRGTNREAVPTSSVVYTAVLRSCGAPQSGFTMVCSTNTLSGVNAKDLAGKYKLQNDINLAGKTYTNSIIAADDRQFSGVFDGNGKQLTNGTINAPGRDYVGVFRWVTSTGVVTNLGVALNLSGREQVGGIAGWNEGTISYSYVTGRVSGSRFIGGVVGYNNEGLLVKVYTTGAVSGNNYVGGVVGQNDAGTVSRSYATGAVSGNSANSYAGGVVGFNNFGTVGDVYATGEISGREFVGGLVGRYNAPTGSSASLRRGYASGRITRTAGASPRFGFILGSESSASGALGALFYRSGMTLPAADSSNPGSPVWVDFSTLNSANVASRFNGFDFTSATPVWQWSATEQRPVLRSMPAGAEQ